MTEAARRPAALPPGLGRLAFMLWLAVVAVSLFVYREGIAALDLRDADDLMRLAEVRDLIAGQSWFDVTQYRINPAGGGGPMHWSRFIDAQIVALTASLRPFMSPEAAERWAAALYPLVLILPLFLLLGRISARLGGRDETIAALLIAAVGVSFLHYFAPLRIDHHNWQLLLSVAMLWLALGEPDFRRGLAAALVITAHIEISLEGFPYLTLFGALFAFDWLRDPRQAPRLKGFVAGLCVFPALWLLAFRGPEVLVSVQCDAFSRPYIIATTTTAVVLLAGLLLPMLAHSWQRRASALGLAGVAGTVAFALSGPSCLDGPFGALEPLVRHYWYDRVLEGQPVWAQKIDFAALYVAPIFVGLGAAIMAWRRARGTGCAYDWDRMLFVLLGSSLLSLLVFRTAATTHAYLVPAFGAMATELWRWSRTRRTALGRVGGAMLVLASLPAFDSWIADRLAIEFFSNRVATIEDRAEAKKASCPTMAMLAPLAGQPPQLVFAPLDIGPSILVGTGHSVLATGHHRSHVEMNRVIDTFLSDPAKAELSIRRSGAAYVALCLRLPEIGNYVRARPHGLAARLARGERIGWLDLDESLSRGDLRVYRVRPAGS